MPTYAVFYITAPGEGDCELIVVATNRKDAVAQFIRETNPDESEWEAHRLSAWGSEVWCRGYMQAMLDADERAAEAEERRAARPAKESER